MYRELIYNFRFIISLRRYYITIYNMRLYKSNVDNDIQCNKLLHLLRCISDTVMMDLTHHYCSIILREHQHNGNYDRKTIIDAY